MKIETFARQLAAHKLVAQELRSSWDYHNWVSWRG